MSGQDRPANARLKQIEFSELDGWKADEHSQALSVFLETCSVLDAPAWNGLKEKARQFGGAREYFESYFRPVLIEDDHQGLFTGYFEPELKGSRNRTDLYTVPIYCAPPEVSSGQVWLSRGEIEDQRALENRDLEIAWISDPVDLYFLQVQGSGRIVTPGGETIRVGFGARNGHPYVSIGKELIRREVFHQDQIAADAIKEWARRNPDEARRLFRHNPSYVFFREMPGISSDKGPIGTLEQPITAMRTIAVDPAFTPLGAPVWLETKGQSLPNRLMVAQDTGSAIKGAQRADIFFGTGAAAGRRAGAMRETGRMIVLLPIQLANAGRAGSTQ